MTQMHNIILPQILLNSIVTFHLLTNCIADDAAIVNLPPFLLEMKSMEDLHHNPTFNVERQCSIK